MMVRPHASQKRGPLRSACIDSEARDRSSRVAGTIHGIRPLGLCQAVLN